MKKLLLLTSMIITTTVHPSEKLTTFEQALQQAQQALAENPAQPLKPLCTEIFRPYISALHITTDVIAFFAGKGLETALELSVKNAQLETEKKALTAQLSESMNNVEKLKQENGGLQHELTERSEREESKLNGPGAELSKDAQNCIAVLEKLTQLDAEIAKTTKENAALHEEMTKLKAREQALEKLLKDAADLQARTQDQLASHTGASHD